MSTRALTFGFGGYADLDMSFGEFFYANHTVMIRFMPQHPYAGPGPMLANGSGGGIYIIGQGGYKEGSGDYKKLGPSTLMVQVAGVKAIYEVPGFENKVGGPVGYRDVWQHLAVVRQGNTMLLYLNGKRLTAYGGPDITVPTSDLPANNATLRIGRRSMGNSFSKKFWQFYGLIGDVAVYTQALSLNQIQQAAAAQTLSGKEAGLLAGWTFDDRRLPQVLSRPVKLPTEANIPEHVNQHAAHPVPVYYVEVSENRNSAEDAMQMDRRPSKVRATVPFGAGEWWKVSQGWEDPGGSHNGDEEGTGFNWDLVRVNGVTEGAPILAAAPGRLIFVDKPDASAKPPNPGEGSISVYHAPSERAVYMHLKPGFFSKYFPNFQGFPQDVPAANQPIFDFRDTIVDVGNHENGDHLHFAVSSISGQLFEDAGPAMPVELTDYYLSKDEGKTWTKVPQGIPVKGDWVSRYPWSPWGNKGDGFSVAPAVSSSHIDRLDVFVRGENNHLWQKQWNGEKWSVWKDLGSGRLTSAPAAVAMKIQAGLNVPLPTHAFVRGFNNQLAHKFKMGEVWSSWEDLGGVLTSAPAVASWAPDRLDVFARGKDNQLLHKRWNGAEWSDWRDLGGRLTSAPAAVSWGPNRIDVFVRGFDGQLAQKRWNGTDWSDWRDLGGRLTSAPAVASWGPNRLDVFVRGFEGQLAQKRWNGEEWSEWRDLGGRLSSAPAAVSWGMNRIDVFVRGFNYQLAHKRWTDDQGWSEWRDLDED